jgi:hypothetical protein
VANRVLLPPKRALEAVLYSQFDFLSLFASSSDSITSILQVSAIVYSGVDSNPSAVIGITSFSGSVVSVLLQNGVVGVIYEILVRVELASGQGPSLCGYLAVIPDLP